jgi:hypothetical protein
MSDDADIVLDEDALNALIIEIVDTECVPRMQRVADACNAGITLGPNQKGYMVSTEGDKPLTKHSYRATCITAGTEAILDNAAHNTLVRNFHVAGGT